MQTDYTQSARKALKLAERAAKACHHSYVGSEHLLLGLVPVSYTHLTLPTN